MEVIVLNGGDNDEGRHKVISRMDQSIKVESEV